MGMADAEEEHHDILRLYMSGDGELARPGRVRCQGIIRVSGQVANNCQSVANSGFVEWKSQAYVQSDLRMLASWKRQRTNP
jgi:hypothetical protein